MQELQSDQQITHAERQAPLQLRILLANVRGLNNKKKQEALKQKVIESQERQVNVMMLTETHLTRPFSMKDWYTTQTRMERKGGALVATSLLRTKAIKTLGSAVAWASVLDDT